MLLHVQTQLVSCKQNRIDAMGDLYIKKLGLGSSIFLGHSDVDAYWCSNYPSMSRRQQI